MVEFLSLKSPWPASDMLPNYDTRCCRRYFGNLGPVYPSTVSAIFIGWCSRQPVYNIEYVGDLLVNGDQNAVSNAQKRIGKCVTVSERGPCRFLGLKIYWNKAGLLLSRTAYKIYIIDRINLTDSKPTKMPLPLAQPLYQEHVTSTYDERKVMEKISFCKLLCSLIYLSARTRVDTAAFVSVLGRVKASPTPPDWKELKSLLRYLEGSLDYWIHWCGNATWKV